MEGDPGSRTTPDFKHKNGIPTKGEQSMGIT
ncbi:hypothetical protein SDC9_80075 [bioreactor metagenome]|uniref:Uncharacterized protein n=1 Tax=bioreactor metagenome TaxID=1076179 RepID=A0A644YYX1_9ZZZZ